MTHIPARSYPHSVQFHPPVRTILQACLDTVRFRLRAGLINEHEAAAYIHEYTGMPILTAMDVIRGDEDAV